MKKIFMMVTAFGMMAVTAQGQACDTLRGNLTSMTLTPSINYVLDGVVVVPDGETFTIRPGVTICAMEDAALVLEQGAQIQAIGKADSLITFTSVKAPHLRAPGDWRGIAWLGDDKTNESLTPSIVRGTSFAYGNTVNPSYNGGTMRYVSITHAGKLVSGDTKPASLFLGALGSATTIDHVQILESAEDAFRIYGGTVTVDDIYIQNAEKSDIFASTGYVGEVTNFLGIKNPSMQTTGYFNNSKGIYVENDGSGSNNTPLTNPTFDAFTLMGPQQCSADPSDQSVGIYFDKNAGGTFKNGVVSGFDAGVHIEDAATAVRTSTDLILEYISIVDNVNINTSNVVTWPMLACPGGMSAWIANGCNNVSVETSISVLGYDNSICEDYCSETPTFTLASSDLQNRELSLLKVGVLQEDPVFTWVQTCTAATCCEENPQARILPLEAYPNPAQHLVKIVVPATTEKELQLKVIDMATGRIMYHGIKAIADAASIDMSTYPVGNYKIIIQTTEAVYQTTINKAK